MRERARQNMRTWRESLTPDRLADIIRKTNEGAARALTGVPRPPEVSKKAKQARWGDKGGWTVHKKREKWLDEHVRKPRGPASELALQARNSALRRAQHRLLMHRRRKPLDRATLCELWPEHTAEDIARILQTEPNRVKVELWDMADEGLLPPPPYARPKGHTTRAEIIEAQRVVDEAERKAKERRLAGLTDEGRKAGSTETHNKAVRRYEEAVRAVRRKGKDPKYSRILEASKELAAKAKKTGKAQLALGERTLGHLMREYPPDRVPEQP